MLSERGDNFVVLELLLTVISFNQIEIIVFVLEGELNFNNLFTNQNLTVLELVPGGFPG